jgi:hypothetical protein
MMFISHFIGTVVEGMMDSKTEKLLETILPVLKESNWVSKDVDEDIEPNEVAEHIRAHAADRIVMLDCECIENDDDYAGLLAMFVENAKLSDKVSDIQSSYIDNQATISCTVDGNVLTGAWSQKSDWVEAEFFTFTNALFSEHFNLHFSVLPSEDQCAECILLDAENGKVLTEFFERVSGNYDPDEVSGNTILLTIFTAVIGFIIFTIVGWFLVGFWPSFGFNLLFWLIFTVYCSLKTVNNQEEQQALEEEIQQNPELIGQMVVDMVDELKKHKK